MTVTTAVSSTGSAWLSGVTPSSPLMPQTAGLSNEAKSQSSMVSISDRAKAAGAAIDKWGLEANGTTYSKDFFAKINALKGQDKIDAYTQAAMQVSADQGLPPGQFDFSKMTRGQALVAANYLQPTASSDGDRTAAAAMISALNSAFGPDASFTSSTFDVRQLLSTASTSETDAGTAKGYKSAIGMIDKLNEQWKKMNAAKSTDASDSAAPGNAADGTSATSSTSLTYTA